MKDKRNKFYQFAAAFLVSKDVQFTFKGSYLTCNQFELTNDATDKTKVWIEKSTWVSFTDLEDFKHWLKTNVK